MSQHIDDMILKWDTENMTKMEEDNKSIAIRSIDATICMHFVCFFRVQFLSLAKLTYSASLLWSLSLRCQPVPACCRSWEFLFWITRIERRFISFSYSVRYLPLLYSLFWTAVAAIMFYFMTLGSVTALAFFHHRLFSCHPSSGPFVYLHIFGGQSFVASCWKTEVQDFVYMHNFIVTIEENI